MKQRGKAKEGCFDAATQMNSIRKQLLARYPDAEETFGYITKEHRQIAKLPKSHCIDAAMIASQGRPVIFEEHRVLLKKCVSDGDYQRTRGVRSEQVIPKGKIQGFRKFDKVCYLGREYFIKGRQTAGYATLMDIQGETVSLKPMAKFEKMERKSARKTWITCYGPIEL